MARAVLMALAIVFGAASVAVALDVAPNAPTTYAATSSALAAADIVAGLGLIVAGCLVWWQRPAAAMGPLALLLGAVWFAPDWVGWESGPPLPRSLGMVAAGLVLPLLLALVLAAPGDRMTGRARLGVAVALAGAAALSLGRAIFRDPFLEPGCWSNCTDNVLLVHADPGLARGLGDLALGITVAAGVLLAAFACRRIASATRPGRAAAWTVLAPAALAASTEAAYAAVLLSEPAEDPDGPVFRAVFLARATAFGCLALGVAWTVVRQRRTTAAIKRLADDLGEAPEPGSLRAALARSLGDPGLTVAYRMPGSHPYVDAEGRPVEAFADGRATTPIVRDGEPVALVVHDATLSGAEALEREIGAAARLAVDNERLRAEALAQLEDLRASRARIVEASESARQRIERDLHDGAQQRLLTLSFELRLARTDAETAGDEELAGLLASSGAGVQVALAELRDLAHGIYPAILTEAGLGPALRTMADDAPLPVEVGEVPEERLPEPVERAAYAVVSGAVEAAANARVDHVTVSLRRDGEDVTVLVGGVESAPPVRLADRVGALGGRIGVEDGSLRAVIPCA